MGLRENVGRKVKYSGAEMTKTWWWKCRGGTGLENISELQFGEF